MYINYHKSSDKIKKKPSVGNERLSPREREGGQCVCVCVGGGYSTINMTDAMNMDKRDP